ncbi:MAG: sensor histidine kinase [Pseudonocardiaceae bacterium]
MTSAEVALTVHFSGATLPPTGGRRLVLPLVTCTTLAAAAATASWWHLWSTSALIGIVNLLVVTSFSITATVLYADSQQRRTACEIGLAAAFYLTSWGWSWPPQWHRSPLALLSFVGGYLWFVCLGTALARYPHAQLQRRYERTLLLAFVAWIVGLKVLLAALSQPYWAGFDEDAWWIPLAPNLEVYTALTTIFNGGLVVLALGLLALLLLKIRRSLGVDRIDALPAVVAAGAIAVMGVPYLAAKILDLPGSVQDGFRIAIAVAALCTPVSFLVVVMRRHVIRSAAADVLPRIYYASSPRDMRDELRRTLRDPDLRLWLWRPAENTHVDVDGVPAEPADDRERCLVDVRSATGRPLAVMGMRTSLRRHGKLVESAAHALGLALERQAGVEEALASRERLNEAGRTARRSLARDLHDGAQQILLTALLRLAMAKRRADPSTVEAIEQARADVDAALSVIRGLAAGDAPPAPSGSLAEAIAELARDMETPVELSVTTQQLPTPLERELWFIVAEGLTNIRKHAVASAVAVSVERYGGEVVLRIVDDGCGGANAARGSGLAGMADRVRALKGCADVVSPVGGGTTITARFPCA